MHTNSRDEALSLPTEESVRIALRTQQIIAHETGVTRTVDPLAGSYYLEYLTKKLEEKVVRLMRQVEELGGARKAIESGFVHREIQESAYRYQKMVDEEKVVIVGVNRFVEKESEPLKLQQIDPQVEKAQTRQLKSFKATRNSAKAKKTLWDLEGSAKRKENLVPRILKAVQAGSTLGEVSDVLRGVFGEYRVRVAV